MTQELVMSAKAFTVGYQADQPVVFDIELTAAPGDVVAFVGPNGSGKSTVLKVLAGQLQPIRGTISLQGKRMDVYRPDLFRQSGVCYAPQIGACFDALTIEDNLRVAAYQLPGRAEANRWVSEMLARFPELEAIRGRRAGALSGGERKVLAFAMTLMPHARVLVLDEPATGLSMEWLEGLGVRVQEAAESGLAVIFTEQNLAFASRVAHRVHVMREGRVVEILQREAFAHFLRASEELLRKTAPNEKDHRG